MNQSYYLICVFLKDLFHSCTESESMWCLCFKPIYRITNDISISLPSLICPHLVPTLFSINTDFFYAITCLFVTWLPLSYIILIWTSSGSESHSLSVSIIISFCEILKTNNGSLIQTIVIGKLRLIRSIRRFRHYASFASLWSVRYLRCPFPYGNQWFPRLARSSPVNHAAYGKNSHILSHAHPRLT